MTTETIHVVQGRVRGQLRHVGVFSTHGRATAAVDALNAGSRPVPRGWATCQTVPLRVPPRSPRHPRRVFIVHGRAAGVALPRAFATEAEADAFARDVQAASPAARLHVTASDVTGA